MSADTGIFAAAVRGRLRARLGDDLVVPVERADLLGRLAVARRPGADLPPGKLAE